MTLTLSTGISSVLPLPFTIHFQIFGEIVEYNAWFVKRSENILFCSKDQSSDIVHRRLWYVSVSRLTCLDRNVSYISYTFQCEVHRSHRGITSGAGSLGNVARDVVKQKGHSGCQLVSLLSIGWGYFLRLLSADHTWCDGMLTVRCGIITVVLL